MHITEITKDMNPGQTGLLLLHHFKDDALLIASMILSQIPMYTGNLNDKWKYWESVCKWIDPEWTVDKGNAAFIEKVFTFSDYCKELPF